MILKRFLVVILCLLIPFQDVFAATSQSIVTDGKTKTTVAVAGNVTSITTSTTRGANAYNSFTTFNLASGNIANLYLPTGTSNLLNLVSGSAATINGILNAVKGGQIGGHVFFIDPYGVAIGASGVVNVGALTVLTPTTAFMNSFFDASGNVSDTATSAALSGAVPISSDGLILVQGKVNAIGDVRLQGNDVTNSGTISTGAAFVAKQPDFSDVVNIKGLQQGSAVTVSNGNIAIVASNNVENSGTISAAGVAGVDGGSVTIQAGNNVALDSGSLIDVSGAGANSNAGSIKISAGNDGTFSQGATLAAAGGDSGNGGSIELSATNILTLAGGDFKAGAANGTAGSILVDPTETDITTSFSTGGGNYTNTGDDIYVYPGVTLSTEGGSLTLDTTGVSYSTTGVNGANSQSINIGVCGTTGTCTSGATTTLDTTNGSGTAGNITLAAASTVSKTWDSSSPDATFNIDQASASVNVASNAVLKGNDVSITATATTTKSATISESSDGSRTKAPDALCIILGGSGCTGDSNAVAATDDLLNLTGINSENYVGGVVGKSTANIQIAGQITASGKVAVDSEATTTTTLKANGLYVTYAESDASATAQVLSGASITAGGDFDLTAHASNTVTNTGKAVAGQSNDNNTVTQDGSAVVFTYTKADTTSEAGLESGSTVSADNVNVTAKNENSYDTEATPSVSSDSSSTQQYGAGVAVAISDTSASADAHLNGKVTATEAISADAESITSQNQVSATAEVSSSSTTSDDDSSNTSSVQTATDTAAEDSSASSSDSRGETSSSLADLGAAIAYAKSTNSASSTAGAGAVLTSGTTTSITADASDTFQASASASASGATANVGGAVAVTNYSNTSTASVTDATIDAGGQLTVKATAELPNALISQLESIEAYLEDFSLLGTTSDLENDVSTATSSLSGAKSVLASFEDIYNNIKDGTTTSLSSSGKGSVGVAGTVDVLTANNSATAYIGTGATVTAQSANVTADATTTSVNTVGSKAAENSSNSAKNSTGSTNSSDSTLLEAGGSYAGLTYNNNATAYIGAGAAVTTTGGDVNVASSATNFMANLISSGAKGSGEIGVSGSASNINENSTSDAYISGQATVNSSQDVKVDAENTTHIYQIADDSDSSSGVSAGVVLSLVNVKDTTSAYIDNASVTAAGDVTVEANAAERLIAVAASSVTAGSSSSSGDSGATQTASSDETSGTSSTADTNENTETSSYSFGLGVSGEIALNHVSDSTTSYIGNNSTVTAVSTTVNATDNALMLALTGGLVRSSTAGLQGAFADNAISKTTEAYIDSSTVDTGALDVQATATDIALAASAGGAAAKGSDSVANLAGSVDYLNITNTTEAYLSGATVQGITGAGSQAGTVDIDASNRETTISAAGSFTYGSSDSALGLGVALDIGNIDTTTKATVDSTSSIVSSGAVDVSAADNDNRLSVVADLGVGSQGDVAASVSYQSLTKDVEADVDGNVQAAGNVTVEAKDDQGGSSLGLPTGLIAVAGAVAGTTGDVALGAAATSSTTEKTVEATIGDNVTVDSTGGTVAVQALSSDTLDLFAGGGSYGESAGFMGSAVVNVVGGSTSAAIGDATVSGNSVDVAASDTLNIIDGAGAISGSSSVAAAAGGDVQVIGTSSDPLTVSSSIASGATVTASNDVTVDATQTQTVYSVAADGAAAGDATVVGSGSALSYFTKTEATSAGDVTANGDMTVSADRESSLTTADGEASVGGSAGIGLSVLVIDRTDTTTAAVTGGSDNVAGTLAVTATGNDTVEATAVGGAVSGSVSVAGSGVVNVLDTTTEAYISDATINANGGNSAQAVEVAANSTTTLPLDLVGTLSIGGDVGIGAGVDVTTISKTTTAEIQADSDVNSGGNVTVAANSSEIANSMAASASGGLYASVSGGSTVFYVDDTTTASVNSGATVAADNNVAVTAADNTALTSLDGEISVGIAGVGAAVAYSDVTKNTSATVDGDVTALGEGSAMTVDDGTFAISYTSFLDSFSPYASKSSTGSAFLNDSMLTGERTATANTTQVHGLAVTATSTNDFNTIAGGATGGLAAVTASGSALTLTNNTTAQINNATINSDNTGAGENGVYVAAGTDVGHLGVAISAGVGGVAVVPATDVSVITNTTTADISGSTVNANGAVNVTANASEDDLSLVAGLGASTADSVAASISYVGVNDTTQAYVSGGSIGSSSQKVGSLTVQSNDDTATDVMVGAISLGLEGDAYGASVGVTTIDKTTNASIANNTDTYTSGATEVNATTNETIDAATVAGSAASYTGLAGGVSIESDASTTSATIGTGTDEAGSLSVLASNAVTAEAFDGSVGAGGVAGLAGSVDVGSVQNAVTAELVGADVTTSTGDVTVDADETRTLTSYAISGAVAAGVGIQASVVDWSVGAAVNTSGAGDTDSNPLSASSYTNRSTSGTSVSSSTVGGSTDSQVQSAASTMQGLLVAGNGSAAGNAEQSASTDLGTLSSSTPASSVIAAAANTQGTTALISGGTVQSAGAVTVQASDSTTMSTVAGGAALAAFAAIGASVNLVTVDTDASAEIVGGANVSANGDVTVDATRSTQLASTTADGQGGLVFGGGAAVDEISDSGSTTAEVAANVTNASTLAVDASTMRNDEAETVELAASVLAGAGYAYAKTDETGTTTAELDGTTTTGGGVSGVQVDANDQSQATAVAYSISAGILSLGGAEAYVDLSPTVDAHIASGADVRTGSDGDVTVVASGAASGSATITAAQISAVSDTVGSDLASVSSTPTVKSYIEGTVNAAGDVTVAARYNYDSNDNAVASCSSGTDCLSADSSMTNGALLANLSDGAESVVTATPTVSASVDGGAVVTAGGEVNIDSESATSAQAVAGGTSLSIIDVPGETLASVTINNNNLASVSDASIKATNFQMAALSTDNINNVTATGSAYGLATINETNATGTITGSTQAAVSNGSTIDATDNVSITAQSSDYADVLAQSKLDGVYTEGYSTAFAGSTTTIDTPSVTVDSTSSITANTATLEADLAQAYFKSKADTHTAGGDANPTATSTVTVVGDPLVQIDGSVSAPESLSLLAVVNDSTSALLADSSATAKIDISFIGTSTATANDNATFDPSVAVNDTATLTTNALTISATAPEAPSGESNPYYTNAGTAASNAVVYKVLETFEEIFDWIPFIGSLIKKITKWVEKEVDSTTESASNGAYKAVPSIKLNGKIVQSGGVNPDIEIAADGTITSNEPSGTVTESNGDVVVGNLENTTGTITLNAPGGTISGDATVVSDTIWSSVNIINNSNLNLVVNNISPLNSGSSTPNLSVTADDESGLNLTYKTDTTSSKVTIENTSTTSAANIELDGTIYDPAGTVSVTAARGSIYGTSTSAISATNIDLTADSGSIGTATTPLNLDAQSIVASSSAAAETANISAQAGQDLYLDITPVETLSTLYTADVLNNTTVAVNLNSIEAGGNIGLTLNPATVTIPTEIEKTVSLLGNDYTYSDYENENYTAASQYNLTGTIAAGGNVNLALPAQANLNLQSGSTIISGFANIDYTVNADGSWTSSPIDVNYATNDGAGSVVLNDLTQQGGDVTISGAGSLSGSGTINVLNGYSNVTITNNSDNNLVVGNLNYGTPVTGTISIFGTTQNIGSNYGSTGIALTETNNPTSTITVQQTGTGDVQLAGMINNPAGTTVIDSANNIVNTGGTSQSIVSNNLTLDATGEIGQSPTDAINIETTNGYVDATASGDVYLAQTTGDMNVGSIESGGTVSLDSTNSILNGDGRSTTNITGQDVQLTATNGSIGTTAAPVYVDSTTLEATANQDVNLASNAVALNATSVTSQTGNIALTANDADLNAVAVTASTGNIVLTASDNVNATDVATTTGNVTMTASNGNVTAADVTVGTGDIVLTASNGDVNAEDVVANAGNITLSAVNDNLETVSAANGTVQVTATDSILNADGRSTTNVTGQDVQLTASNGSIGTTAAPVYVDSTTLEATANQDVDLASNAVALNATSVTSQTGNVNLTANDADLNAVDVTASTGNIVLTASDNVNATDVATITGNVTLMASNGDVNAGDVATMIGNVMLVAPNGDVNANDVVANAGNVTLSAINDNLETVSAANGTVQVTATDSILNADGRSTTNVTGQDVQLTATNGSIGTTAAPVYVDSTTLEATANQDVDLASNAVALNAASVTSQTGNVNLTANDADLNAVDVTASTGNIVLTASDNVNATDVATITGNVTLSAINDNLETVSAANGTVQVTAIDSILNADGRSTTNVTGQDVQLTATNGSIGTTAAPVYVDSTTLEATANQDVNLASNAVALNATSVTSQTGNINLTANDADLNAVDVTAALGDITLTASNGNVNAEDVVATAGNVTLSASNYSMAADDVTALAGNVVLPEVKGGINIDTVSAVHGTVTATATGSILNADQRTDANIMAENVVLTAITGAIGTTANALNIDPTSSLNLTASANQDVNITNVLGSMNVLNAQSQTGNVNLKVSAGDMAVDTITATAGTVNLTASGAILNGDSRQSTANVVSDNLNLTANTTDLGSAADYFVTQVSGTVNAAAGRNIYLRQLGSLTSQSLTSNTGSINVEVNGSSANLQTVSSPNTVNLTVDGDLLNIDLLQAKVANLVVQQDNGWTIVAEAQIANTLNITTADVHIGQLVPTTGNVYFGIYTTKDAASEGPLNFGPLDPEASQNSNMDSEQYQEWWKKFHRHQGPLPTKSLITDQTVQATNAGAAL